MPVLLLAITEGPGQPPSEIVRQAAPGGFARASAVQDLAAVVSGVAPGPPILAAPPSATGTGSITVRQTGAGIVTMTRDTGRNSVTLAATAVSARIVLP